MPISPTKYLDSAMKNSKQINIVCIIRDGSKQSQQDTKREVKPKYV